MTRRVVLQRLFVWPNRLIIPTRGLENPLIKPILPRIQSHMKGLVAVVVKRGAGLPIECASPAEPPAAPLSAARAPVSADSECQSREPMVTLGPSVSWHGRHALLAHGPAPMLVPTASKRRRFDIARDVPRAKERVHRRRAGKRSDRMRIDGWHARRHACACAPAAAHVAARPA